VAHYHGYNFGSDIDELGGIIEWPTKMGEILVQGW
jgi:hypothetical protein